MTSDPKALADEIESTLNYPTSTRAMFLDIVPLNGWKVILAALRAAPGAEAMRERAAAYHDDLAEYHEAFSEHALDAHAGFAKAHRRDAAAIRALTPDPGSAPAEGWRPIETVPKFNDVIAARLDRGAFRAAVSCLSAGIWWDWPYGGEPTHWMPLPSPLPEPPRQSLSDAQEGRS